MSAPTYDVCRPCGACCASLRVSFADHELASNGGRVPDALTAPRSPGHVRLLQRDGACVAFDGVVGVHTGCTVYANRPSPCADFQPSTAAAVNVHCDEARARFGLPPLR